MDSKSILYHNNMGYNVLIFYIILWTTSDIIQRNYYLPRNIIYSNTSYQWKIHQMDVKSVFLNGHICEDIYMQQPPSFINVESSSLVCKLHKCFYALAYGWVERCSEIVGCD